MVYKVFYTVLTPNAGIARAIIVMSSFMKVF